MDVEFCNANYAYPPNSCVILVIVPTFANINMNAKKEQKLELCLWKPILSPTGQNSVTNSVTLSTKKIQIHENNLMCCFWIHIFSSRHLLCFIYKKKGL